MQQAGQNASTGIANAALGVGNNLSSIYGGIGNNQADAIEQQAGNADGGATTNNTPNTSPSGSAAH